MHRPAELQREDRRNDLVREHLRLGSETSTYFGRDHAQPVARELQRVGEHVAYHEQRLRRGIEGEHAAEGIVARDAAVRIQCGTRLAVRAEALPHHDVRIGFGRIDVADAHPITVEDVAFAELVVHPRVQPRRAGKDGLVGFQHHGQRVVDDLDRLERVHRLIFGLGDYGCEFLAFEHDLVDCEGKMVADEQVLHQVAPRLDLADQFRPGQHAMHAGHAPGARGIDLDVGMRVGASQHLAVEHAGQLDVVDIARGAGEECEILLARHGTPDKLAGVRSALSADGLVHCCFSPYPADTLVPPTMSGRRSPPASGGVRSRCRGS